MKIAIFFNRAPVDSIFSIDLWGGSKRALYGSLQISGRDKSATAAQSEYFLVKDVTILIFELVDIWKYVTNDWTSPCL